MNKIVLYKWWNNTSETICKDLCKKLNFDFTNLSDENLLVLYNEHTKSFNEQDWTFERSSGYAGYRNYETGEWIFSDDMFERVRLKKENALWEEQVFRIIKLHTKSNALTEEIVNELRRNINISSK